MVLAIISPISIWHTRRLSRNEFVNWHINQFQSALVETSVMSESLDQDESNEHDESSEIKKLSIVRETQAENMETEISEPLTMGMV